MRELLLLRHGATESNERRVFTGAQDVPLSVNGARQLLARRAAYPRATAFFTSGMLRARQTLALLYDEDTATDIPDLAEYRFGDFEGRGHDELYETDARYRAWLGEGGDDVVPPGGESRTAFRARVTRGWDALLSHPWDGLAVVVTHGGVIHTLMGGDTPENGCGYRVQLGDGGEILSVEAFACGQA